MSQELSWTIPTPLQSGHIFLATWTHQTGGQTHTDSPIFSLSFLSSLWTKPHTRLAITGCLQLARRGVFKHLEILKYFGLGETWHQDSKFQFLWKDWNMWQLRAHIPLGLGLESSWRTCSPGHYGFATTYELTPDLLLRTDTLSDPHRHRLVPLLF